MKIQLFIVLFWVNIPLMAQKKIEKHLKYSPGQEVDLNLKFADSIRVRYWDKPEVSVAIDVKINNGKLDEAFLVKTSETKETVRLETDLDSELTKQGKPEDCPGGGNYNVTNGHVQSATCAEIRYLVYLPRKAALRLSTINGNVLVEGSGAPVSVKTISGFVDMTWPSSRGAELSLKSITGEVYSDLAIQFRGEKKKNPMVGYNIKGIARDGGPQLHLESVSNDIYLRAQ